MSQEIQDQPDTKAGESPDKDVSFDFVTLTKIEQRALSEILISSKSQSGINKQRVMKLLRARHDEVFEGFLRKVNRVLGDSLKLIYDRESDRCIPLTRANAQWTQEILDDRQLALLLFCFYLGMTSRTGKITFDELHGYFQRSSLYAERKLQNALETLVKSGFLRVEELPGDDEETKRVYQLTGIAKNAFPLEFLQRITNESQGGQVTMEQVHSFFGLDRQLVKNGEFTEGAEQFQLF